MLHSTKTLWFLPKSERCVSLGVFDVVQLLIWFLMKLTLRYWIIGFRSFEETYCPKFKEKKYLCQHFNCWTREQHVASKSPQWRSDICQRKEINFRGLYFLVLLSYFQETTHEILFNHISLIFIPDHLMERLCLSYSFSFPFIQLSGPNRLRSRLIMVRVLPIRRL